MKLYKPKEDFKKSLNVQNSYVEVLKKYHTELLEKSRKSKGYQKAKFNVELFELAQKLDSQIELLKEKVWHYNDVFIGPYEIELKECSENFEDIWKKSLNYITKNIKKETEICNKMKFLTEDYLSLDEDNKDHIEIKNVIYKDLKTLLSMDK
jgi:nucleoside-triphosphatase THEP1|tara:strand:+ start:57 stop:512 length:456 start_codon:yes stop_codon:yes gene_type:complete